MDYQFSSKEELYKRVGPALRAKLQELHRLGYSYVKVEDIWNYLIKTKWCKGKDLMLSDIVSDILHTKVLEIDKFLKEKLEEVKRTQYFDESLDILWGELHEKEK